MVKFENLLSHCGKKITLYWVEVWFEVKLNPLLILVFRVICRCLKPNLFYGFALAEIKTSFCYWWCGILILNNKGCWQKFIFWTNIYHKLGPDRLELIILCIIEKKIYYHPSCLLSIKESFTVYVLIIQIISFKSK